MFHIHRIPKDKEKLKYILFSIFTVRKTSKFFLKSIVETWSIPRKTASTIKGKGGINIRRLQENHHVTIHIHEQEKDSDSQKITVKGQQQNTTNARTEIDEIVNNFGRTQHLQKTTARHETDCIYYASGYCKNGNKCGFVHWRHKAKPRDKCPVPSTSRQNRNEDRSRSPINRKR